MDVKLTIEIWKVTVAIELQPNWEHQLSFYLNINKYVYTKFETVKMYARQMYFSHRLLL